MAMSEITFTVSPSEETGMLVAAWDAPDGGGITTQGSSVEELRANIREAVACHFDESKGPGTLQSILRQAGIGLEEFRDLL
jgi:predicted RNase H-like HicB family nuclease